ncbi:MAG: transcriptional regulator NrdR [Patescibacteria group bacterium]|nr:transcriptional regulator NrdR [Patescibacteria group bacterium]
MKCPLCQYDETEVIETRVLENGSVIRRRRNCLKCQKRFTTYERVEELPILVIKRDGRRERFDREKLRRSIVLPCNKTTISSDQIENLVNEVEKEIKQKDKTEIESKEIGNLVAKKLKKIDKVAYIRFAAVFKRFVDLEEFQKELKKLL